MSAILAGLALLLALTGSGHRVTLVLDRLPHAGMRDVVVVADFTERLSAALRLTVCTYRCSAVGTLGDGRFATRHSIVAVAGHEFDLAVHCSTSHASSHVCVVA
jgi:hypothetical protein